MKFVVWPDDVTGNLCERHGAMCRRCRSGRRIEAGRDDVDGAAIGPTVRSAGCLNECVQRETGSREVEAWTADRTRQNDRVIQKEVGEYGGLDRKLPGGLNESYGFLVCRHLRARD